ncbi:MAG: glucan biosynthesis protein, partial [Luteimonas sp.]|nr:glucan biosynthesis protein [Luteimonas sp.]
MALAANRLFAASPAASGPATAFDDETVPALARALAARAYAAPSTVLPAWLADISYDQYRDIRFRGDHALWHDDGLRFQAQFFHRGFLFKEGVTMHVVEGGRSRELPYRSADFEFGPSLHPSGDDAALGFAGFRLHAPLNRPDYFDELCVFLGASYFRAVAPGLAYGLSARGLALGSGDPGAEEFPRFSQFWLETPAASADHVVVHALLDSPSVAGAFRFDIRPGEVVAFDVDARLYPRKPLPNAGIAALTSMYEFDAGDRVGTDDFRPAVHDSDGLSLVNGAGEQVWRPLRNPAQVEHCG